MRGIFFDEDDTRATRGRSVADAPEVALELLVERYDSWLDAEEPAPLHLPFRTERHHRDP